MNIRIGVLGKKFTGRWPYCVSARAPSTLMYLKQDTPGSPLIELYLKTAKIFW
jgi:hypothetical protein